MMNYASIHKKGGPLLWSQRSQQEKLVYDSFILVNQVCRSLVKSTSSTAVTAVTVPMSASTLRYAPFNIDLNTMYFGFLASRTWNFTEMSSSSVRSWEKKRRKKREKMPDQAIYYVHRSLKFRHVWDNIIAEQVRCKSVQNKTSGFVILNTWMRDFHG